MFFSQGINNAFSNAYGKVNAIASVTWTIRSGPGFVQLKAKKFLDSFNYEQLVVHGYLANVIFID